ncbi:DUF819 family protein [Clostridium bowmanii]|uniref:DUF819 family protein n=1 Tax=Clostridium bowmanii TaxID=132925 RepID=UPI001C0D6D91|nr:DUF819 family protein [Clostridium bowmanii]MBU3188259.1 DUF819 family protein [Clostridium bowmanii]MCA1072645.1 DUF819 family protein [Clostridium bowmanii]
MHTLINADNTWALWAILTGFAALSIYLEQEYKWANRLTGCVLALLFMMILSNLKIIPTDAPTYDNVWGYVVPLAIPLLLFKADAKKIWKDSGRILAIYFISGIGTIVGAIIGFQLLKNHIPKLNVIAAMMTGTYTGGSVNFAAMADHFNVAKELAAAAVVADNLLMALYFFVLTTIPSIGFFKKTYKHPLMDELEKSTDPNSGKTQAATFWGAKEISLLDIATAVASSFIIVAVSTMIADYFNGFIHIGPESGLGLNLLVGLIGNKYLIITTFTMLLATFFSNFFGNINGSQEIGTFLIYIFFCVIGAPASISLIIHKSPLLLVFCLIIVLVNMIFSLGFGKLFKFDLEQIILASNANIGGPTTAAAMAIAKGWGALVIPVLLVGTLGYIVGNYYGIFVGNIL